MMKNQSSINPDWTLTGPGLHSIWEVEADPAYDVTRARTPDRNLILIRTLGGHGRMRLLSGESFALSGNSCAVFERRKIQRYCCVSEEWRFWWFDFIPEQHLPVPVPCVFQVSDTENESEQFRDIFRLLRLPEPLHRLAAFYGFMKLVYLWTAFAGNEQTGRLHRSVIEPAIEAMHRQLGGGLQISELARQVHLSERHFRLRFRQLTGESPKAYYNRLRLERGAGLLAFGLYSVSEVADLLGFSSPFHFSRAFSAHYGLPPSQVLKTQSADAARKK